MNLHRTRLIASFLYALGVPAFAYGLNTWTQAHVQRQAIEGRAPALRTAQFRFNGTVAFDGWDTGWPTPTGPLAPVDWANVYPSAANATWHVTTFQTRRPKYRDFEPMETDLFRGMFKVRAKKPEGEGFFGNLLDRRGLYIGNGVVVTAARYFERAHKDRVMVEGAGQDTRKLRGDGRLLGVDPTTGLAAIRIAEADATGDIPPVELRRDIPAQGEPLLVVGPPAANAGAGAYTIATTGIVSGYQFGGDATEHVTIMADVRTNEASIGSPVFDSKGRAVGVVVESGQLAQVLPVSLITASVERIEHGKVPKPSCLPAVKPTSEERR